jgi:hypothetical protein
MVYYILLWMALVSNGSSNWGMKIFKDKRFYMPNCDFVWKDKWLTIKHILLVNNINKL